MLAAFVVAWTSLINELSLINGDNQVEEVLMVLVSSSVHRSLSVCPRNFQEHLDLKEVPGAKTPPMWLDFSLLPFSALEINQKDINWNLKILFHHPVSLYITLSSSAVKTSMGPGDNVSEGH